MKKIILLILISNLSFAATKKTYYINKHVPIKAQMKKIQNDINNKAKDDADRAKRQAQLREDKRNNPQYYAPSNKMSEDLIAAYKNMIVGDYWRFIGNALKSFGYNESVFGISENAYYSVANVYLAKDRSIYSSEELNFLNACEFAYINLSRKYNETIRTIPESERNATIEIFGELDRIRKRIPGQQ
jgi:hypothetical protein